MKAVNKSSPYIHLLACAALLAIYLLIIFILRTEPFSDFLSYYLVAKELRSGGELSNFYKYFQAPGYPYLLATIFSTLGSDSIIVPQIFNAAVVVFLCFILMHNDLSQLGYLRPVTFLITAFNINYMSMIPVLCSEIPFALFLMTGIVLLWQVLRIAEERSARRFRVYLLALIAGVFLGASQSVRPVTIPLMLLFTGIYMVARRILRTRTPSDVTCREHPKILGAFVALWAGVVITAISAYSYAGYGLTFQPHQKGLWNVYVGFNHESKGGWNEIDAARLSPIGEALNWRAEQLNPVLLPLVIERAKKNWKAQFGVLPQKMETLLNPARIPEWALAKSAVRNPEPIFKVARVWTVLNLVVMVASIIGLLSTLVKKTVTPAECFGASMTAGILVYLLLHSYFLEVQPRYANHLWLILIWLFTLNLTTIRRTYAKIRGSGP